MLLHHKQQWKSQEGVKTFRNHYEGQTLSVSWTSSCRLGDGSSIIQRSCGEHNATRPTRRQASSSGSSVLPVLEWIEVTRGLCSAECQLCNSGSLRCCVMNRWCLMIYLNVLMFESKWCPLSWMACFVSKGAFAVNVPCDFGLMCAWGSSAPRSLWSCAFVCRQVCGGSLFFPPPLSSLLFPVRKLSMFIFLMLLFHFNPLTVHLQCFCLLILSFIKNWRD